MSQLIEHQPIKNKYQSRVARFWASRSYAFRAATYGAVGGIAVLGCAALETCLPSSGAFVVNKIITPAVLASPFAASIFDAVQQYRQMSKIPGIHKIDAAQIAAEAGLKVGLIHTTMTWMAIIAPSVILHNNHVNQVEPVLRNFANFVVLTTVYVGTPLLAWAMRNDTKNDLCRKFGISTLVIDDLQKPSSEPRDVTPHKPAPVGTPRITDAKLEPFTID